MSCPRCEGHKIEKLEQERDAALRLLSEIRERHNCPGPFCVICEILKEQGKRKDEVRCECRFNGRIVQGVCEECGLRGEDEPPAGMDGYEVPQPILKCNIWKACNAERGHAGPCRK